ncbi:MAG: iron chelate uptake ABC transporter family permease subunit [Candidatus Thermoplasmatota archaeon]
MTDKRHSTDILYLKKKLKYSFIILVLIFILFLTIVLAVFIGPTNIPIHTIISILLSKIPCINSFILHSWQPYEEVIVVLIRLPRVVLGAVVGSALSIAGCSMQGIFRNPMADPYIIGISSGAGFGACLSIVFGISTVGSYTVPVFAFLGALCTAFIVCRIATVGGKIPTNTLLLSGIAVGSFFSACISFLIYHAGERLHGVIFWLMGGLWGADWTAVSIVFPTVLASSLILIFFAKTLNALQLGEEQAHHSGINVERSKILILIFSVLITSVAVAFTGTIGFVGLIIPHMTRIFVGPNHRILLPVSTLIGAIFLVWADTIARSISPEDFPVGMITAFCGAPFFAYLLKTQKRWRL